MKRLISLLISASLLLGLAACGVYTPTGNSGATPPPVTDNTLPDPPPEEENAPTPDDTQDLPPEDETTTPPDDNTTGPPEDETPSTDPDQDDDSQEYIRTVDPYAPMVALTFDDGPHGTYSPQILDVLEANNSVATFFEVGYNARLYPDILARIVELGCELASHSNSHTDLTTLSRDAMLTDLAKLDQIVYDATGTLPTLIRPPYGAVNSMVKNESGRAMVTWTVDPQDWRYRDAQALIDYLQNYGDLDGEIVLMHSIHESTAEAMETLVPWLIEQGYQLVTVSELMAYYYGELLEANKFYNQTWFARHERTEFPLELPDEPMQTNIPEFTVVPVVPTPPDTPDTPEPPPEENPEPPAPDENPDEEDPGSAEEPAPPPGEEPAPDAPPQDGDTIPGEDVTPPNDSNTTPPEDTTPPDSGETTPPESDIPPEENIPPES